MKLYLASLLFISPILALADHQGTLSLDRPAPLMGSEKPKDFENIGITEKLGDSIDLSIPVFDESGTQTTLGKYFEQGRPVSLSLVYYSCPGLCSLHLNGVFDALKKMNWTAGDQFEIVALSFEPKDTTELAKAKKANYLREYLSEPGHAGAEKGVHFLTASQASITKITDEVGFKFKWNEESKDWSHASAAIIATPDGKISRYLHGIDFEPATYKLALSEAAGGKIGGIVDKMIWYCFRYDPHQSKYVLYAFRAVQMGAILITLILAFLILPTLLKGRKSP